MYLVGKVLKPQGNRGEVKAEIITSFPEHFASLKTLYIEDHNDFKACAVESVRLARDFVYLRFSNIHSIAEAESIRGKELYISENDLSSLAEDEYYIHELIGMTVYDEHEVSLGKLVDVETYPANDVYIIERENLTRASIPAVKEIILKIDQNKKQIIIRALDGLLD